MTASQLISELQKWKHEYEAISQSRIDAPAGFWQFLASRLEELGVAEADPDVINVLISKVPRKVRVTGLRGPMLCVEYADGARGMSLVPIQDVPDSERPKLTAILGRLERDGKIGVPPRA